MATRAIIPARAGIHAVSARLLPRRLGHETRLAIIAVLAGIALLPAGPAPAQTPAAATADDPGWPQWEVRADAFLADVDAVHIGLGINLPLNSYVRLGLAGAGGAAWVDDERVGSARVDVVARLLLDPLRQQRWGFYAGGGGGVRYDGPDRVRGQLIVVVGLESPAIGGLAPSLEVGLGDGLRLGIVLRQQFQGRR
ncbi:MAG: hypothetical protein ACRENI_11590 [Gemmatimonadaceae bacterium]